MQRQLCSSFLCFVLLSLAAVLVSRQEKSVSVSDRNIPIVEDVDLLVVGGSTEKVAAAVEAAKSGAKVLLLTPFSYLGDDLTGTLDLSIASKEAVDDPLVTELYTDSAPNSPANAQQELLRNNKRLRFTYRIEEPIDPRHPENSGKPVLTDGKAEDPQRESLQVNGTATIVADLGQKQNVGAVILWPFTSRNNFEVSAMNVFIGNDNSTWNPVAENVKTESPEPGSTLGTNFVLTLEKPVAARYVKVEAVKHKDSTRVLLGELQLFADKNDLKTVTPPSPIAADAPKLLRPMHVKRTLDKTLLDAGVKFYYGVYLNGLLTNPHGEAQGAFISNRAGRQAVLAKKILCDPSVTESKKDGETATAEFSVIGGQPCDVSPATFPLLKKTTVNVSVRPYFAPWPNEAKTSTGEFFLIRYRFDIEPELAWSIRNGDIRKLAELEKQIRLATFHPDQQATSDAVTVRLASDEERTLSERVKQGRQQGKELADAVKSVAPVDPKRLSLQQEKKNDGVTVSGEVCEILNGLKTFDTPLGVLPHPGETIPVAGEFDVVVVGGGTCGVPAAIGAGRTGAKTLLVEYLHDLGGVGTAGAISIYCWGYREGFTKEVEDGKRSWNIEQRMFWWRNALARDNVETWYGVLGTGVLAETTDSGRKVKGVLLATAAGPKIVLAKIVIDATGNADLAAAAGAETRFAGDDRELAIQGTGLPPRNLGTSYTNTDYMYVDETDIKDTTHVFVYAKNRFPQAFDLAKMLDTRERRRIVGDEMMTVLDQMNCRTYPDTIAHVYTNYDSHGTVSHRILEFPYDYYGAHPSNVPYRASLPKGLDGLLVAGLATSGDRDALAVFRMQPDVQNQGYALGHIAGIALKDNVSLRKIDRRKVQRHLVDIGSLREEVLEQSDNYAATVDELPEIVKNLPESYHGTCRLLWHPKESVPLLKEALKNATEKDAKIAYASVLAALDDPSGADVLLEAVNGMAQWDEGPRWSFRSTVHGYSVSEYGRLVLALGRTKDPRAVPVIAQKLKLLAPQYHWRHARACLQALETIGTLQAGAVAAELLKETSGYSRTSWTESTESLRGKSILEISAARVLYRCGDTPDGLGRKTLDSYAQDVRGVFSRHAVEVLGTAQK